MIALLVIVGFLAFCIFLMLFFDYKMGKKVLTEKIEPKDEWTDFFEKVKVLNGTEVDGKIFWINAGEVVSWGNKCYDVGNYSLYENKFFIELGRVVDDDWYDSEGMRHPGCKLIGTFVIHGVLPEK